MRIKIQAHGIPELVAQLRYTAHRITDASRKQMHRSADHIVKEAQLNAPVDLHNLEESIRKEVSYGVRGRLQIDIVMGGTVNGVNVDEYAIQVHEHYDEDNPGPGTQAKREANPQRHVGGKFLERALDDNFNRINTEIVRVVLKEWHL